MSKTLKKSEVFKVMEDALRKQAKQYTLTKHDPVWQYLEMLSKNDLNKGIKHVLAAAALASTPATLSTDSDAASLKPIPTVNNVMSPREQKAHDLKTATKAQHPTWDKQKTLKAIAQQESSGGKNTNHALIEQGTEKGTYAHGCYGLTDNLIRETIKNSPRLSEKHAVVVDMDNEHIDEYLENNPDLEHDIAGRYHDRISKELGTTHPSAVYIGWLHGIEGAKKYLQNHKMEEHQIGAQVLGHYHKVK